MHACVRACTCMCQSGRTVRRLPMCAPHFKFLGGWHRMEYRLSELLFRTLRDASRQSSATVLCCLGWQRARLLFKIVRSSILFCAVLRRLCHLRLNVRPALLIESVHHQEVLYEATHAEDMNDLYKDEIWAEIASTVQSKHGAWKLISWISFVFDIRLSADVCSCSLSVCVCVLARTRVCACERERESTRLW